MMPCCPRGSSPQEYSHTAKVGGVRLRLCCVRRGWERDTHSRLTNPSDTRRNNRSVPREAQTCPSARRPIAKRWRGCSREPTDDGRRRDGQHATDASEMYMDVPTPDMGQTGGKRGQVCMYVYVRRATSADDSTMLSSTAGLGNSGRRCRRSQ
eukprot:scaffold9409_cov116-Isochrysis_galbana.AAC.5